MDRPVSPSLARPAGRPPSAGRRAGPARRGREPERPRSRNTGYAEPRIHARDLGRKGPITPFHHLARTQLWSVGGDAFITAALATTVFFNSDPNAPREKVALYLVLTLAPFAVASPFIGPLLDRLAGGRKWMIFGSAVMRALVAFLLIGDLENFRFYIWAFLMLVLSKIHLISKSAVLPTTVRNDAELVEANSKLSLLGALAGALAGGPGFAMAKLVGPQWTIGIALVAFVITAVHAFGLPLTRVAAQPVGEAERVELQGAGIIRAAEAMSALRFVVGFLTFAILFNFRAEKVDGWRYAVAALSAQTGLLIGSAIAPRLRKLLIEERMIMLALGSTCLAAALAAVLDGFGTACLLAAVVGCMASVAKQGFDALVQRDAPDANRGRTFARFESRFQLVWVVGAFLPVVIPWFTLSVAFATIAIVGLFWSGSYFIGFRQIRMAAAGLRPPIPPRDPLHLRIYHLFRPVASDEVAVVTTGEHDVPDPMATGFLTDEQDPFGAYDPTLAEGALDAPELPPLAPSNPLVSGRWRSPQPEELFTTSDLGLPVPPAEVTPTGLFAPAVTTVPVPPPAPAGAPVTAPVPGIGGAAWFEDAPAFGYVEHAAPATAPVPEAEEPLAPESESESGSESERVPGREVLPVAVARSEAMAPPEPARERVPPPPAGVRVDVPSETPYPSAEPSGGDVPPAAHREPPTVPTPIVPAPPAGAAHPVVEEPTLPFDPPASGADWEVAVPRWRDTGEQPLPGIDPD